MSERIPVTPTARALRYRSKLLLEEQLLTRNSLPAAFVDLDGNETREEVVEKEIDLLMVMEADLLKSDLEEQQAIANAIAQNTNRTLAFNSPQIIHTSNSISQSSFSNPIIQPTNFA